MFVVFYLIIMRYIVGFFYIMFFCNFFCGDFIYLGIDLGVYCMNLFFVRCDYINICEFKREVVVGF